MENERNLYTAIKMEKERYSQDTRKITSDVLKLETQKEAKCSHLKHLVSKLDKLKLSVKWDEKTIEVLETQVSRKMDDNELLKKFSNEDQKRANELEIKRMRLREEEIARRQLVVRVANEIECAELTLGRNMQMYKQMCEERNTMVRQWQESVKQLQQINKNTLEIFAEIHVLREQIQTNNQTLEEQRQFAENEKANNYQLELLIAHEKAETAQLRMKLEKTLTMVQDRNVEKNELTRDLRVTALALEKQRAELRKFDTALAKQQQAFSSILVVITRLKEKLTSVTETSISAAERLRQLDEMIKAEENLHKSSLYDIERMQETLFRSQSSLADLKDAFKVKEMSQKILDTAIVSLKKQIGQTEYQSQKTAEAIYKLNLRINFLECKLARATGEREDENAETNHLKLEELEKTMARLTEAGNLIQSQITRVEEDMRRLTIYISNDADILSKLKDCLQDNLLLVEGAIKRVAQNQARNNKIRVNQNVLAVRVQGAERALKKEGCVVYNLQLHKMELECAIRERQAEIQAQYELLFTKRRALENDVGRMNADIQNREIRIEQLKKRVECVLESLGKSEDGEALSVTYFKVRNAQEKYNLQQEGDRLDALIRKTEREIVAMENTLRVMNNTNDLYKNTLALLEDDAEELAVLQKLQERLAEISQELRATNTKFMERSRLVRSLRMALEVARNRFQEISDAKFQKHNVLNEISRGENERKAVLARAEAASKILDCVCGDEYKDMTTRQLREINKYSLQQLAEISIRHLAAAPVIYRYLLERNLTLPSASLSSRASSRRSAMSNRSVKTAKSETSTTSIISAVTLTLNLP